MDVVTREYFRLRPLCIQNLLWDLEIHGDKIALTTRLIEYEPPTTSKRKPIYEFSRQSRLRLLKFCATIDWKGHNMGVFVSLTYPDSVVATTARERSIQLHSFHRRVENYLGKNTCALWRLEWKPRQSGAYRGKFCPHFHLIYPTVKFLDKHKLRQWWRSTLQVKGPLCTDVKALSSEKKHAVYLAKYMAKVPDSPALDYASYLSIGGRHYGYLRKGLIPRCEKKTIIDIPAAAVARLRTIAATAFPWYDLKFDAGFTLLGPTARKFADQIREILLACGTGSA
jgi:hypothetical protein